VHSLYTDVYLAFRCALRMRLLFCHSFGVTVASGSVDSFVSVGQLGLLDYHIWLYGIGNWSLINTVGEPNQHRWSRDRPAGPLSEFCGNNGQWCNTRGGCYGIKKAQLMSAFWITILTLRRREEHQLMTLTRFNTDASQPKTSEARHWGKVVPFRHHP
jgi:hypothetical protein